MTVYTLGIWTVKAGRELDFVRAWQELAEQTKLDFPDGTATLLRDRAHPSQFISFGPWESLEQIEQWRGSDMFKQGVAKLRELLGEFTPHTMDLSAQIL
jgi:heme-degrading monooxygenase HmoA